MLSKKARWLPEIIVKPRIKGFEGHLVWNGLNYSITIFTDINTPAHYRPGHRIGDKRLIETRPAIWESSADFIDLHLYPDAGLTLDQFVDNYKMAGMQEKPIIIGEMGAARASYNSAAALAQVLQTW